MSFVRLAVLVWLLTAVNVGLPSTQVQAQNLHELSCVDLSDARSDAITERNWGQLAKVGDRLTKCEEPGTRSYSIAFADQVRGLYRSGKHVEAGLKAEQANRDPGVRDSAVVSYINEIAGRALNAEGEFSKADHFYRTAIYYSSSRSPRDQAQLWVNAGSNLENYSRRWNDVQEYFETAVRIAEENNVDPALRARAHLYLSHVIFTEGRERFDKGKAAFSDPNNARRHLVAADKLLDSIPVRDAYREHMLAAGQHSLFEALEGNRDAAYFWSDYAINRANASSNTLLQIQAQMIRSNAQILLGEYAEANATLDGLEAQARDASLENIISAIAARRLTAASRSGDEEGAYAALKQLADAGSVSTDLVQEYVSNVPAPGQMVWPWVLGVMAALVAGSFFDVRQWTLGPIAREKAHGEVPDEPRADRRPHRNDEASSEEASSKEASGKAPDDEAPHDMAQTEEDDATPDVPEISGDGDGSLPPPPIRLNGKRPEGDRGPYPSFRSMSPLPQEPVPSGSDAEDDVKIWRVPVLNHELGHVAVNYPEPILAQLIFPSIGFYEGEDATLYVCFHSPNGSSHHVFRRGERLESDAAPRPPFDRTPLKGDYVIADVGPYSAVPICAFTQLDDRRGDSLV